MRLFEHLSESDVELLNLERNMDPMALSSQTTSPNLFAAWWSHDKNSELATMIMEPDIPGRHHTVESAPQPALEVRPRKGKQQHQRE